jgi:hypothetical protein
MRRRKNNIKMERKLKVRGVEGTHLDQDNEHQVSIKCGKILD